MGLGAWAWHASLVLRRMPEAATPGLWAQPEARRVCGVFQGGETVAPR